MGFLIYYELLIFATNYFYMLLYQTAALKTIEYVLLFQCEDQEDQIPTDTEETGPTDPPTAVLGVPGTIVIVEVIKDKEVSIFSVKV